MSTEENNTLVRRLIEEVWNQGNLAVFDALYAPDFVFHDQGDFMGIPPTGKYVTTTAIVITRIFNGKGIEAWINGDDLGRMQQLGVIPTLRPASP